MQRLILDSIDLNIINLLGKNSRLSYRNIARTVGLTTKSVKSRVDKMISAKVIERFIVLVNPSILGYKVTCAFALKRNMVNRDLIDRISLVGDVQYKFHVLGGAVGFSIAVREGSEDKIELLLKSLQPAILGVAIQNPIYSTSKTRSYNLTITDYYIIKQLIQNPRMEISELGKAISISAKTVRRRLDKMQNNHILEFTILPNPNAMKGQITFFLEVKVENSRLYRAVLEKIFHELHNHLILSSILHDQVERIGLILASEDIFKIESIRSQIESLNGVKEANVFLPTKIEYNQDSIVKAIEGKITMIEKPYKNIITK